MSDKDLVSQQEARDAVEAAHGAFRVVAEFDQEKIDSICSAMSKAALAESVRLGKLAQRETGFGKAEDKAEKNRFASEKVWHYFKDLKTVGVVNDKGNVVEVASPRGVVAGIIPSTNPTSTAIFKIIISIKSRNTIVISPHPSAEDCINEAIRIMRDAGEKAGLPKDAIQCLKSATIEGTETLMKHKKTSVILATGGLGLVRAAYSSGKPAFGVGPGNVPVFIEKSANVKKAVADILTGTCFDNGTICASEQAVVCESGVESEVREEFVKQGAVFLGNEDATRVGDILLTPQRTLNSKIVGQSAEFIANLAGVSVAAGTRCLIADCQGVGRDYPWSVEKLSPTLAFFVVQDVSSGAALCQDILKFGGMGHTAGMHTQNREAAVGYGKKMPASRIVINSPTTHGAIGFSTDLAPSMTLGCGSWGGNVTSDNVSPIHLMDIKRIAFETEPVNGELAKMKAVRDEVSLPFAPTQNPNPKENRKEIVRRDIVRLVDSFLSEKLKEAPKNQASESIADTQQKAIVHQVSANENRNIAEFVSENDVRDACNAEKKIYITKKTIVTPAARDLGDEKNIFVEA